MKINQLKEQLLKAKKVVITSHQSPDGDAIGSSLGLQLALAKQGITSTVVVPDAVPPYLFWLPQADGILVYQNHENEIDSLMAEADVIFSLDYNHPSRVGELGNAIIGSSAVKAMIDHHREPSDFCDYTLSDITASSTAELVFNFLEELDFASDIDADIASCLYSGIVTDTASFKHNSTTKRTHQVAAALIDAGINASQIQGKLFDTNRLTRLKLLGFILTEKLELVADNRVAIISLTQQEEQQFQVQKGDTEGFVNYGLSIDTVQLAAFFREDPEKGIVKISFRSVNDVDVNRFARTHFNGGGHKNAAGGRSDDDIITTIDNFKNLVTKFLNEV